VLAVAGAVALVALGARAAYISAVHGDKLSGMAARQQQARVEIPAPRGAIVTSDGRELAVDRLAVSVSATPYLVTDPATTAAKVGPVIGAEAAEVERKLRTRGGYVSLARNLDPRRARYLRSLKLPGIEFRDTAQRFFPLGRVGSQLVGLTDDYNEGLSGLEARLDRTLTGTAGHREEARDPFGRPLRVIADREPVPGRTARLAVSGAIQDRTERVLAATVKRFGAKGASAVVMRPSDGAVLAIATVPRYDPNDRRTLRPEVERLRAVTDTHEPGSTFKLVAVAGAIESGVVSPATVISLPSTLRLYDRELGEAHPRPAVAWSVGEILARSSNVGTVKVAMKLGVRRFQDWVSRFGFGSTSGIDYPGEVAGFVLPTKEWSGTSILNIPIGQGVSVTLLQMARAYAAVANGGHLVTPHVVESVGGDRRTPPRGARVMKASTARALDAMLRDVVSPDGTGALAEINGFTVAGKTGTANKVDEKTGLYVKRYVASFVGYAPAERPAVLVAVAVDEPRSGAIFGGEVAAPAFEQIMEFSLQHLGVAPTR
jgi:cell division protein FtsI/penicillin-binding protein 2